MGDDWVLFWEPQAPYVHGTPRVVQAVRAALPGGRRRLVTPTGPDVPNAVSSPLAVYSALMDTCGCDFLTSSNAPQIPGIPEDAMG